MTANKTSALTKIATAAKNQALLHQLQAQQEEVIQLREALAAKEDAEKQHKTSKSRTLFQFCSFND